MGKKKLVLDPRIAPLHEINSAARRLHRTERLELLGHIKKQLLRSGIRRSEEERISAATLLVALLPESEKTIKQLLKAKGDLCAYELHFSLFCFLDFVREAAEKANFAAQVPEIVEDYLSSLDVEKASAGWMAAHLMDEHWDEKAGLECLLRVISDGRYACGRRIAIHIVTARLQNLRTPSQKHVTELLQEVSLRDRSGKIRSQVRWKLNRLGVGRT